MYTLVFLRRRSLDEIEQGDRGEVLKRLDQIEVNREYHMTLEIRSLLTLSWIGSWSPTATESEREKRIYVRSVESGYDLYSVLCMHSFACPSLEALLRLQTR